MVRVPPSGAASLAACEVAANGADVGGGETPTASVGWRNPGYCGALPVFASLIWAFPVNEYELLY